MLHVAPSTVFAKQKNSLLGVFLHIALSNRLRKTDVGEADNRGLSSRVSQSATQNNSARFPHFMPSVGCPDGGRS